MIKVHDIKPRSKNQLLMIICSLETHNIDTKKIELDDWKELTVRLSLRYKDKGGQPIYIGTTCSSVYKEEKSYNEFCLENQAIDVHADFDGIMNLLDRIALFSN